MAKRALRVDEIGRWSEIKLEIVRKYAAAYSVVMAKQAFSKGHLYIDAFAGAGTHRSKTSGAAVEGSPVIAMQVSPPFTELHFIDLDGTRAAELRRLAASDPRVRVHEGDCNKVLLDDVFPRCQYQDYKRALCLLDPYGLNVGWGVLRTAGQMQSVDVFYNFMIMDANMNVFLRDPDRILPDQAKRMDFVWGDDTWRRAVYRSVPNLFGESDQKVNNEDIAEAFRRRLESVAGFAFVPTPIPMRNSKGATVYYLYFASANRTGARIVGEIFDRYRDVGGR
jgi:three-Cys-motif partner protein